MKYVLGIESTCDETGIAVVGDGWKILSNVVMTQEDLHARYGGVIPEVACRRHADVLLPLLKRSLHEAGLTLEEIDLIAVAKGPGLIGALLVGVNFARGLALSTRKPLVGVNHIEAHLYSTILDQRPPFPALGVVVSGGHTSLLLAESVGSYQMIGKTQDDAIGEAFDKAARLLGLPYPGGPEIEKLARGGDPKRYPFRAGTLKGRPFDFSFSGLKTALLYRIKGQNAQKTGSITLSDLEKKDLAASFQRAAFADVINKIELAADHFSCNSILIGGGVSQNRAFRAMLAEQVSLPTFWPAPGLCLDNGAMIAALGYHYHREGETTSSFQADPRLGVTHALARSSLDPTRSY